MFDCFNLFICYFYTYHCFVTVKNVIPPFPVGSQIISLGIKFNSLTQILLILEVKFGSSSWRDLYFLKHCKMVWEKIEKKFLCNTGLREEMVKRWATYLSIDNITNTFSKIILCRMVSIDSAPKMKFSIKDFFSKCDQIRMTLRIYVSSKVKLDLNLNLC